MGPVGCFGKNKNKNKNKKRQSLTINIFKGLNILYLVDTNDAILLICQIHQQIINA